MRVVVEHLQQKFEAPQRRVCRAVNQPRSTQRYQSKRPSDEEQQLVKRMHELVRQHPRYGYRFICERLRLEGWRVNRKRIHRLWKQEHLKVPQKQRKKRHVGSSAHSVVRHRAGHKDHVWAWDFIYDSDVRGRSLKWLSIMDEFTRECLALEVDRSITSGDVLDHLTELMLIRGIPKFIRSDNGPEFVADAIRKHLARANVHAGYIEPGAPWENGYIESFHSRLRDELLNAEEFDGVRDAKQHAARWKNEYNHRRLHSSLGYMTPAMFAATCEAGRSRIAPLAGPAVGASPLPPARPASPDSPVQTLITAGT